LQLAMRNDVTIDNLERGAIELSKNVEGQKCFLRNDLKRRSFWWIRSCRNKVKI